MNLAVAEAAYNFEHRDLHLGNILISTISNDIVRFKLRGQWIELTTEGIKVVLIDFTLSRMETGEMTIFKDLSAEPEIFTGPPRNPQADTYRRMKKAVKNEWNTKMLKTNCMWMHYLSDEILAMKTLSLSAHEKQALRLFKYVAK